MNNNDFLFERTGLMLDEAQCDALRKAKVLIVGTGGVGGYALENIARAGVGELTIVDGDLVDITNCNRQLSALTGCVDLPKVRVWQERISQINPQARVNAIHRFIRSRAEFEELLNGGFDFAVDAIDELGPKIDLIVALKSRNIPFVSAMGAGGKLDPSAVKIADISKTAGCPLAKLVRKKLREQHIEKGVTAVYSPEPPCRKFQDRRIGSISFMPAIFGCFCAAEAIRHITGIIK